MITSKVTAKGQVTLPKEIREQLDLRPGDTLTYELQPPGAVTVRKARRFDREWYQALSNTLAEEWNSPEDEEAFRDL
jgi:AbrB family looped-hinge helix DNA binding protein